MTATKEHAQRANTPPFLELQDGYNPEQRHDRVVVVNTIVAAKVSVN